MAGAIVDAVNAFCADRQPFRIRGGGSKEFLGPIDADLPILDTREHSGVMQYEPGELIIRAKAGTTMAELNTLLAGEGQMLGFEPPAFDGEATLGGAIATALSGARRPFTGAARDFVLGVGLVTGEGKHLEFGGQVMKNVAGFDVSRLVTGAYGTLGVITDVSLKVLPAPEVEVTLAVTADCHKAHDLMLDLACRSLPVSGACHLREREQCYIRFSGSQAAVDAARNLDVLKRASETNEDPFTDLAHYRISHDENLWRLSVPATGSAMLDEAVAIDWAGAQRFVTDSDEPHLEEGHAMLVRSKGSKESAETRSLFAPLSGAVMKIHERLKCTFDPDGLINPGRMYETI